MGDSWEVQDLPKAQGAYGYSIVQDGSHANCEAYYQDWYLEDGACLIQGRGQGFLFVFNELERMRSMMFICIVEHGTNIRSLKMSDLRRCCKKTQNWCAYPTRCFFCVGWEPLHPCLDAIANCIVMIHLGTYLQIWFYSRLLKGLWSCSQPWLTWTRPPHFDWFLKTWWFLSCLQSLISWAHV